MVMLGEVVMILDLRKQGLTEVDPKSRTGTGPK